MVPDLWGEGCGKDGSFMAEHSTYTDSLPFDQLWVPVLTAGHLLQQSSMLCFLFV